MAALSDDDRKVRTAHMKEFGAWLKQHGKTQRWAGEQLGIYPGYVSNLITGKQIASESVCFIAATLMGPREAEPAGTPRKRKKASRPKPPLVKRKPEPKVTRLPKHRPSVRRHYRRPPTPLEIEVTKDVVIAMISSRPQMTPDELVAVTRALIEGFTSPI